MKKLYKFNLMKLFRSVQLIAAVLAISLLVGCVTGDDFSTPDTSVSEPILDGPEISIAAVAGQLAQEQGNTELDYTDEETVYTYEFTSQPQYLVGYVVSSDEGGNFFEEIVIQDQPENPTIGIKILIDVNPISVRYDPGRKIYLQVNGLSTGITNGVLSIGLRNGNSVDNIPAALESEVLQRSPEVETMVPLPMDIQDFQDNKTNLFVRLEDVQFNRNQVIGDRILSYASEQFDQFDGERLLESCASGASTIFSTSTFADFKNLTLPAGRGPIDAVLTKDFFGEVFNVRVNTPEDVDLVNNERCDPDFLDCDGPSGGGSAIFSEDFQNFNGFENEGWTNVNISGGNRDWIIGSFSGNAYSQITGFNANEDVIDVWLVTPEINMGTTTGEEFSFDIQVNFDNGNILTVWASEDFAGDPTTATWFPLDITIPTGPGNGFGDFESIPPVNVSCLEGTVHFGFFYQGSDPDASTRYHVDNVTVTGN